MKRLWAIALVIIAFLALPACEKGGDQRASGKAQSADESTKVTYAGFVKGWLEDNCTSCHDADGDSPDLSSYEAAKKHGDDIVKAIQSKKSPMPPDGPVPSASTVSKIKAWVAAGSPKGSSKGGGSGSASLTWDDWVDDYLDKECASCHKAGATPPDLTSYKEVKANIDAIIDSIQNEESPMPPSGLPSAKIVDKMESWKDAGMPKTAASDDGDDDGGGGGGGASALTYDSWVRGWLAEKCTSCHKPDGSAAPDLSTYEAAKANVDAILASIQDTQNPMPPAGGSPGADSVEKIEAWKAAGMPKGEASADTKPATSTKISTSTKTSTATGTSAKPSTSTKTGTATATNTSTSTGEVTYEGAVRAYLSSRCTGCHKPGDTSPDLTTYATAKAAAPRVLARVNGKDSKGLMPPAGAVAPANILTMLEAWIAGGTKEK